MDNEVVHLFEQQTEVNSTIIKRLKDDNDLIQSLYKLVEQLYRRVEQLEAHSLAIQQQLSTLDKELAHLNREMFRHLIKE